MKKVRTVQGTEHSISDSSGLGSFSEGSFEKCDNKKVEKTINFESKTETDENEQKKLISLRHELHYCDKTVTKESISPLKTSSYNFTSITPISSQWLSSNQSSLTITNKLLLNFDSINENLKNHTNTESKINEDFLLNQSTNIKTEKTNDMFNDKKHNKVYGKHALNYDHNDIINICKNKSHLKRKSIFDSPAKREKFFKTSQEPQQSINNISRIDASNHHIQQSPFNVFFSSKKQFHEKLLNSNFKNQFVQPKQDFLQKNTCSGIETQLKLQHFMKHLTSKRFNDSKVVKQKAKELSNISTRRGDKSHDNTNTTPTETTRNNFLTPQRDQARGKKSTNKKNLNDEKLCKTNDSNQSNNRSSKYFSLHTSPISSSLPPSSHFCSSFSNCNNHLSELFQYYSHHQLNSTFNYPLHSTLKSFFSVVHDDASCNEAPSLNHQTLCHENIKQYKASYESNRLNLQLNGNNEVDEYMRGNKIEVHLGSDEFLDKEEKRLKQIETYVKKQLSKIEKKKNLLKSNQKENKILQKVTSEKEDNTSRNDEWLESKDKRRVERAIPLGDLTNSFHNRTSNRVNELCDGKKRKNFSSSNNNYYFNGMFVINEKLDDLKKIASFVKSSKECFKVFIGNNHKINEFDNNKYINVNKEQTVKDKYCEKSTLLCDSDLKDEEINYIHKRIKNKINKKRSKNRFKNYPLSTTKKISKNKLKFLKETKIKYFYNKNKRKTDPSNANTSSIIISKNNGQISRHKKNKGSKKTLNAHKTHTAEDLFVIDI